MHADDSHQDPRRKGRTAADPRPNPPPAGPPAFACDAPQPPIAISGSVQGPRRIVGFIGELPPRERQTAKLAGPAALFLSAEPPFHLALGSCNSRRLAPRCSPKRRSRAPLPSDGRGWRTAPGEGFAGHGPQMVSGNEAPPPEEFRAFPVGRADQAGATMLILARLGSGLCEPDWTISDVVARGLTQFQSHRGTFRPRPLPRGIEVSTMS